MAKLHFRALLYVLLQVLLILHHSAIKYMIMITDTDCLLLIIYGVIGLLCVVLQFNIEGLRQHQTQSPGSERDSAIY